MPKKTNYQRCTCYFMVTAIKDENDKLLPIHRKAIQNPNFTLLERLQEYHEAIKLFEWDVLIYVRICNGIKEGGCGNSQQLEHRLFQLPMNGELMEMERMFPECIASEMHLLWEGKEITKKIEEQPFIYSTAVERVRV